MLVVGRLGEGEGVLDLLEAQVAGHEPGPDQGQVLQRVAARTHWRAVERDTR